MRLAFYILWVCLWFPVGLLLRAVLGVAGGLLDLLVDLDDNIYYRLGKPFKCILEGADRGRRQEEDSDSETEEG